MFHRMRKSLPPPVKHCLSLHSPLSSLSFTKWSLDFPPFINYFSCVGVLYILYFKLNTTECRVSNDSFAIFLLHKSGLLNTPYSLIVIFINSAAISKKWEKIIFENNIRLLIFPLRLTNSSWEQTDLSVNVHFSYVPNERHF